MSQSKSTIVAMGGGGFSMEPENPLLDDYVLSLVDKARPKICFLPTAGGDSNEYIVKFYSAFQSDRCEPSHLSLFRRTVSDLQRFVTEQDIIYVGGCNTANMLAAWRVHGLDTTLNEAWSRGVVLCGLSAGSVCWYEGGVTDSFGMPLRALTNGLGFLSGSHCPHYDGEKNRRPAYHELLAAGELESGIAADDGVALRYEGQDLVEIVSSRRNARAWTVESVDGKIREEELVPKYLGDNR